MPSIEGIDINGTTIGNCYAMFYPDTYKQIQNLNLFHYSLPLLGSICSEHSTKATSNCSQSSSSMG